MWHRPKIRGAFAGAAGPAKCLSEAVRDWEIVIIDRLHWTGLCEAGNAWGHRYSGPSAKPDLHASFARYKSFLASIWAGLRRICRKFGNAAGERYGARPGDRKNTS